jgi:hypothetical protein
MQIGKFKLQAKIISSDVLDRDSAFDTRTSFLDVFLQKPLSLALYEGLVTNRNPECRGLHHFSFPGFFAN